MSAKITTLTKQEGSSNGSFASLVSFALIVKVSVHSLEQASPSRFARRTELSREAGDVLTSPLFPGLDIPLSHVFGD
jgi:hypothetical protein